MQPKELNFTNPQSKNENQKIRIAKAKKRERGRTCAHCMRATLPSQSIFCVDSSGRAVEQSITVWMPTSAAGRLVGSCTRRTKTFSNF
jgi:hypothetical protein